MRILVVCGAGASSTFLVHWMRRVAESRGLDLAVDAGSQDDLAGRLTGLDAVLVGAHLAEAFPQLHGAATAAGVTSAPTTDAAFGNINPRPSLERRGFSCRKPGTMCKRPAAGRVQTLTTPEGLMLPGATRSGS